MSSIILVPTQPSNSGFEREKNGLEYRVFANRYRPNPDPTSRHLGSVDLFIPCFELHVSCVWWRNDRGHEELTMPRVLMKSPNGQRHHKTLARWATAAAHERFQCCGLRALHELLAATGRDHTGEPQGLRRAGGR